MCEAILVTLREHARSFAEALATHQEDNPLQVREALRAARRSPFMAQWKRAGLHSGAGFSRGLLYALYYTVLVPFGVLARRSKAPARSPRAPTQGADSRSQFKSQY